MIARTRLSVTLYVYCLSFWFYHFTLYYSVETISLNNLRLSLRQELKLGYSPAAIRLVTGAISL